MRSMLAAAVLSLGLLSSSGAQTGPASMEPFEALTGAPWTASAEGFSTVLSYRWLLPGVMVEATNEVRGADGSVLARYHGAYVWDGERNEIVFWTASDAGELHRGRAWWRDGVLWHEATVSSGRIEGYASAVKAFDGRLEYYADYTRRDAGAYLLETRPIEYKRSDAVRK